MSCRNSATLHAMDRPSKVEVPRPISSRIMRLRSVALLTMLAVSFISTMKVDCPRENTINQTDPGVGRRHKTADLRHQHNERDLADVGRFSRHIRPGNNGKSQL